jgi:hypothetical protein
MPTSAPNRRRSDSEYALEPRVQLGGALVAYLPFAIVEMVEIDHARVGEQREVDVIEFADGASLGAPPTRSRSASGAR